MRFASDTPICIVGAGPGGLSAAFYLRSAGYTNVTILERSPEVGGKCHSPNVDGLAYDLGALEVTPEYTHVLPLVEKYGLAMTGIGGIRLLDVATGRVYPGSYMNHGLGLLKDLELGKDVLQYFYELLRSTESLKAPGFHALTPDLAQPLSQWLAAHDMAAMSRMFAIPVTCYGYGPLDQVPAAYVLKYLDRVNYTMLLDDAGADLLGRAGAWPRRIVTGYQSLMRRMAEDLAATGTRIITGAEIASMTRDQPGPHPVHVEFFAGGTAMAEEFDQVVLASLLTAEALSFLDLSPEERALLSLVRVCHYYTSLCEVPGLEVGTYAMMVRDGEVVEPPLGHPFMIIKNWTETDLVTLYTWTTAPIPVPEVEARVRQSMAAMHLDLRGIRQTLQWSYFPHVDSEALAAGFYDRLTALMGRRSTWYAGGLMNFEDVEKCFEWSAHLVDRHFA